VDIIAFSLFAGTAPKNGPRQKEAKRVVFFFYYYYLEYKCIAKTSRCFVIWRTYEDGSDAKCTRRTILNSDS